MNVNEALLEVVNALAPYIPYAILILASIFTIEFAQLFYRYRIRPKIRGNLGETKVNKILSKLPEDIYKTVNNVMVKSKNGTTQIDHIVVSVYGIFVIETKNYSGWISGSEYSEYWTQSMNKNSKETFYNPIRQNYGHIKALEKLLSIPMSSFISIIVFTDEHAVLKINTKKAIVIQCNELYQTIRAHTNRLLTYKETLEIVPILQNANIIDTEQRKKHTQKIQERKHSKTNYSDAKICPRCSGKLVQKAGKYGMFLGCSQFPKCRYTASIDKHTTKNLDFST
ncbi:MAG: NERD domain-containing protein [Clostridiales bacterium]|nr:NERD domain-containing protein [Clostridiales bacterium]